MIREGVASEPAASAEVTLLVGAGGTTIGSRAGGVGWWAQALKPRAAPTTQRFRNDNEVRNDK
jgi:hypothetical protein